MQSIPPVNGIISLNEFVTKLYNSRQLQPISGFLFSSDHSDYALFNATKGRGEMDNHNRQIKSELL